MEKNKYVALIMNRIYSKDGNFVYVASHPSIGYIDKKSQIFKDQNNQEYIRVTDRDLMISEVNEAYYGEMAIDELMMKQKGNTNRRIAIANYFKNADKYIYVVSTLNNGGPFLCPISIDEVKKKMNGICGKIESYLDSETIDNYNDQETEYAEIDVYDEKYDDEENYEKSNKGVDLKELLEKVVTEIMMNIENDKYTMSQLNNIKYYFKDIKDLADSVMKSVDIELLQNSVSEQGVPELKSKPRKKVINLPSKYINIKELYDKIKRTLIAQDEPLKRVLTEIARKEQNDASKTRGILLTGSTGVGKTKMMSLIAKYMDRPFYKIDSTRLTVPGYVGDDIEEHLWNLYVQCGKDKKKTEEAIVFFDEIDKKGSSKKDDISGKGVLNSLLPFIEGSKYNATEDTKKQGETVLIDTSNMTVIFGGAFTDVYKYLDKNHEIGFDRNVSDNNKVKPAKIDDFIEKAKMPDEFMGRVSIVKLNDLDIDGIKKILLDSDESAIKIQQELFSKLGVKLTIGDDYIETIAKQAVERKTGARGLNTVVDDTTWEAYADAYMNLGLYEEVVLGKETVEDPKQYKKVIRGGINN